MGFSDSETLVFITCLIIAPIVWIRWYNFGKLVRGIPPVAPGRWLLWLVPALASGGLLLVLLTLSSPDVRYSPMYLFFYWLMGGAWLGLAVLFMPFAGLSARDDAVERRNSSAIFAVCGALIGIMLCFAGGNIGSGPGWWVVVYSAGLATIGLFVTWIGLQVVTHITDTVTIGRDVAAGLRLAGFLIAAGIIFGRAVTGDWYGYGETIADFVRFGWPVFAIAFAAVLIEMQAKPTTERPFGPVFAFGLLPATLYVAVATLIVLILEPLSLSVAR